VIESVFGHPAWRLVSWLPGVTLRWIFNPRRMTSLVEFDVRPRGDPLEFDCGETPYVTLWLTVRNGLPFAVDLDRARVDVWCCSRRLGELWFLDRIRLRAGTAKDLILRGLAGGRYDQFIRQSGPSALCSIQVRAHFESKVGRFVHDTRQLEMIHPGFVNGPGVVAS